MNYISTAGGLYFKPYYVKPSIVVDDFNEEDGEPTITTGKSNR